MKKSNLITGISYFAIGVISLGLALTFESNLDSMFFGIAGAGIAPGVMVIYKYFYWNKPENKERYREKIENEAIERHDELKVKLRDRSGRYAYVIGLVTICVSIVVFSILAKLQITINSRIIVLYLGAYLISQIFVGIFFYKQLLRKY